MVNSIWSFKFLAARVVMPQVLSGLLVLRGSGGVNIGRIVGHTWGLYYDPSSKLLVSPIITPKVLPHILP